MIKETRNFDWGETRKKLCVFMPSFTFPELTEFSIQSIRTKVDPEDYIIIIGNDNIPHNWDHLKPLNVKFFTLLREGVPAGTPRNGCFIRNYFLKRAQCERYVMKDAEVVLYGDFIYNAMHFRTGWRPSTIYSLLENQTEAYMKAEGHASFLAEKCTPKMEVRHPVFEDAYQLKQMLLDADGQVNPTTYYHYAYGTNLADVVSINGYDEDYCSYGWEDSDMYCRLFARDQVICPDAECTAVHPYHKKTGDSKVAVVANMRDVFVGKSPMAWVRNHKGWGEGE